MVKHIWPQLNLKIIEIIISSSRYLINELEGITSRKGGSFCFLCEKKGSRSGLKDQIQGQKRFETILPGKNQGNFEFGFGKI